MAKPDVFSGSLSRRDLLKLGAQGALGIAAWATIGCGDNNSIAPTQTSRSEPAQTSSHLDTLSSPPEGFRAFRSTYFPYEALVPSDWKYFSPGRDMFNDPKNPNTSMIIFPQETNNWVTMEAYENAISNDFAGYKITKISPGAKSSDPLYSKLSELAAMSMDNKSPRVMHIAPPPEAASLDVSRVIAFTFNKTVNKAWVILVEYDFPRATAREQTLSLYDKLGVAMKSFHSLA